MFETFFSVRDRCPRCNFPIRREEGHMIGAVGINTIVTLGLVLVTMVIGFALMLDDRRAAPILISCSLVAIVAPIGMAQLMRAMTRRQTKHGNSGGLERYREHREAVEASRRRSDAG